MCQNIAVETKVCSLYTKVENILIGSLDSIPSPSSSGNIPIIAQQPKWQKSWSKLWPIEQLYIELGARSEIKSSEQLQ